MNKVLVIAHPDDELFHFGPMFYTEIFYGDPSKLHVVSIFDTEDGRIDTLVDMSNTYGFKYTYYNIPDDHENIQIDLIIDYIRNFFKNTFRRRSFQIFTHGYFGENVNHIHHILVSCLLSAFYPENTYVLNWEEMYYPHTIRYKLQPYDYDKMLFLLSEYYGGELEALISYHLIKSRIEFVPASSDCAELVVRKYLPKYYETIFGKDFTTSHNREFDIDYNVLTKILPLHVDFVVVVCPNDERIIGIIEDFYHSHDQKIDILIYHDDPAYYREFKIKYSDKNVINQMGQVGRFLPGKIGVFVLCKPTRFYQDDTITSMKDMIRSNKDLKYLVTYDTEISTDALKMDLFREYRLDYSVTLSDKNISYYAKCLIPAAKKVFLYAKM